MKKCMCALTAGVILTAALGAVCMMKKKPKTKGVRHAAEKLISGVNDFLDDLGLL